MKVVLELRHKYPFNKIISYLKLSKSSYYYTVKNMSKENKDLALEKRIKEIFNQNHARYGYRRITLKLNKEMKINHKKVKRIMKELGLFGIQGKAKYKSYRGEFSKICDNYLLVDGKRNFETTHLNEKWTTDITEFHIASGKLYLSPILDMYNKEIVAYSISKSPNFDQISEMLSKAFSKYSDLKGLIFHSDQGWQYQMKSYQKILKDKGIIQSMSRKGNCLDNSIMENFFGIMKNEMFYGHEYEFTSLKDLEQAIINYINYYNEERIKVKLKGLSPLEYRQQSQLTLH